MTAPDPLADLELEQEGPHYSDLAPSSRFEPAYRLTALRPEVEARIAGTVDKMLERVSHDLEYIRSWTFGLDLRVVWLTVFGKGTRQNAY